MGLIEGVKRGLHVPFKTPASHLRFILVHWTTLLIDNSLAEAKSPFLNINLKKLIARLITQHCVIPSFLPRVKVLMFNSYI